MLKIDSVYTTMPRVGRPPKPEHERRSKMLPIRLTADEIAEFESAAQRMGITVADILRDGGRLYIQAKGKDGHRIRKEKKER